MQKLGELLGQQTDPEVTKKAKEVSAHCSATLAEGLIMCVCIEQPADMRARVDDAIKKVTATGQDLGMDVRSMVHPTILKDGVSRALGGRKR